MKSEVVHGYKTAVSREFKIEAVKLVTERGVAASQVARDLDVHENVLRKWVREQRGDPQQAFPGQRADEARAGRDRLAQERKREAQDGARHSEKSRGLLREGIDVRFCFMAKHRGIWPVAIMSGALGVSRSGFYAWLGRSPSKRQRDDELLGAQVRQSFIRSDRTYGARRVWHDVLALGLQFGVHRIERLMREQAFRARPRRRGLPQDKGSRSVIADNVLDRQFQAEAPNQKWLADFTYIWTAEGWLYVAAVLDLYARRIVGWSMQESMTSQLVADALMMAVWRRGKPVELLHPLGPGQPVHQRALPGLAQGERHYLLDESRWRGVGQLGDGELLQFNEDGANQPQDLPHPGTGTCRCVRLHRALLQSDASPFNTRLRQSGTVRGGFKSLKVCLRNRQQPNALLQKTDLLDQERHRTPDQFGDGAAGIGE